MFFCLKKIKWEYRDNFYININFKVKLFLKDKFQKYIINTPVFLLIIKIIINIYLLTLPQIISLWRHSPHK